MVSDKIHGRQATHLIVDELSMPAPLPKEYLIMAPRAHGKSRLGDAVRAAMIAGGCIDTSTIAGATVTSEPAPTSTPATVTKEEWDIFLGKRMAEALDRSSSHSVDALRHSATLDAMEHARKAAAAAGKAMGELGKAASEIDWSAARKAIEKASGAYQWSDYVADVLDGEPPLQQPAVPMQTKGDHVGSW